MLRLTGEAVLLCAIGLFSATHVNGAAPRRVVIYKGDYPGWPWVARSKDSTLFCVFREGTRHGFSASGRVRFTKSTDGGLSWSPAVVIADKPGVDDRNAAIAVLPGGALLVSYNTYTADLISQAFVIRSGDGGRTWTRPVPLDMTNSRTRSASVVLHDGSVLLPYYLAPASGALAGLSRDGGLTWKTYRVPDAPGFSGDEWSVLEVSPGHLVGLMRNGIRGSDGGFWVTESRNGGRTWQTPQKTNVRSLRYPSPPCLTRCRGRPILVYADRRMVSVSAVRTHDPHFKTWDTEKRILCYTYRPDERPIREGSYPCAVEIAPGRLLIVDYEIRAREKVIAAYIVKVRI